MNKQAIHELIEQKYMDMYHGYIGCDIQILFIVEEYGFETYEEDLETFLYLFKKFVDDGLILVYCPIKGEPTKEIQGDIFWDASSDKMIKYIRSILPKELKFLDICPNDINDEYIKFWYSKCPEIRWVVKQTAKYIRI